MKGRKKQSFDVIIFEMPTGRLHLIPQPSFAFKSFQDSIL